jgi:hypothetical protein
MRATMARLPTHLPPALLAPAPLSRFTCQSIGGRRFGGIRGVLFAQRQLPLQVGDLLFGVGDLPLLLGDLLIPFGYLLTEFLNLTLLSLDLPLQFFPTRRMRVRMPTRRCLLVAGAPSGSRIHPPYVKRFGEICPALKPAESAEKVRYNHIHTKLCSGEPGGGSMPMTPFVERFPEVGARETRSVTVTHRQDLPDGEYGFVELYCDEPDCDCRRVMIDVLRPETGWSEVWATISYGWESLDFYRKWGGAATDPIEMKEPYLDPLNPQTKYSFALLNLFRFLLQSPDYVERLKQHYQMFRDSVEKGPGRHDSLETNRIQNRRKRLHDSSRRRRQPH